MAMAAAHGPAGDDEQLEQEDTAETLKRLRTNEKSRHTKLINKIMCHIQNSESKSRLRMLREDLMEVHEECVKIHGLFLMRAFCEGLNTDNAGQWLQQLTDYYQVCLKAIDDHLAARALEPQTPSTCHTRSSSRMESEGLGATSTPKNDDDEERNKQIHDLSLLLSQHTVRETPRGFAPVAFNSIRPHGPPPKILFPAATSAPPPIPPHLVAPMAGNVLTQAGFDEAPLPMPPVTTAPSAVLGSGAIFPTGVRPKIKSEASTVPPPLNPLTNAMLVQNQMTTVTASSQADIKATVSTFQAVPKSTAPINQYVAASQHFVPASQFLSTVQTSQYFPISQPSVTMSQFSPFNQPSFGTQSANAYTNLPSWAYPAASVSTIYAPPRAPITAPYYQYPQLAYQYPYPHLMHPAVYPPMIMGPTSVPSVTQAAASTAQGAISVPTSSMNTASNGPAIGNKSWVDVLGTPEEVVTASSLKAPKIDLPQFDGDAKEWPSFIAGFKILVHDAAKTDAQRMFLLRKYLGPQVREHIGEALLNPGLYHHALKELQQKYGSRQAVSQACTTKLLALKSFGDDDFAALRQFSSTVRGVVATLRNGGYTEQLACSSTLLQLVAKLPRLLRKDWGKRSWSLEPKVPTLADFDEWLDGVFMEEALAQPLTSHEESSKSKASNQKEASKKNKSGSVTVLATGGTDKPAVECPACSKDHTLAGCQKFKDLPLEKRGELILKKRCCFRCLKTGHRSIDCRKNKPCNRDGCKHKHHPLMHGVQLQLNRNQNSQEDNQAATAPSAPVLVGSTTGKLSNGTVLLPIVPVIVRNGQNEFKTFALLDCGSQVSLIRADAAEKLKLTGKSENLKIGTFHARDPTLKVQRVNFQVESRDGSAVFRISDGIAVPNLNITQRALQAGRVKQDWPHLSDVPLPDVGSAEVTVLIGMDCSDAHDILETRKDSVRKNAPRALRTQFGWCLIGRVGGNFGGSQSCMLISSISTPGSDQDNDLHEAVERFWSIESFGTKPNVKKPISKEDQRAIEILRKTTRHIDGRYEVGLLWKHEKPMLPDNHEQALRRFLSLEKRFAADPEFATAYTKTIEEYISLGHAQLVTNDTLVESGRTSLLCHHGVRNPNKPGKVRVVFDASAKFNGVSLNDRLLKGPDLLTSLVGVLIRFRQNAVPVSADVEKMFHQVRVAEVDRPALRFYWRPPGSKQPPQIYEMQVQVFGAACSPTICTHALRQTAEDHKAEFPDLVAKVTDNFYVDNYLDSFQSIDEAIVKSKEMSELLMKGGFKLTQWGSANKQVLASLHGELLSNPSLNLDLGELPTERTLGLRWNCQKDEFEMTVHLNNPGDTKRNLLRAVTSIFDPIGFLTPVVMTARIILQDLWRLRVDWDLTIPPEIAARWSEWAGALHHLETISVPRCYRTTMEAPISVQIHVFSDASENGYGAVAYLRFEYQEEINVAFVASKSRVAPLQFLTIPRMELNGAVLACRLATMVMKELRVKIDQTFYWTDSTTVLRWLNSTSCRFHTFVANRVGEILEETPASSWNYVPTKLNPADDCSRGVAASVLSTGHRWFVGPEFLKMRPDEWPKFPDIQHPPAADDPEIRSSLVNAVKVQEPGPFEQLMKRRSSLRLIERATAWIIRFITNLKKGKQNRIGGPLLADEINAAKLHLIRLAQSGCFADELEDVASSKPVEKGSRLQGVTPFLDSHGILRVGGRLKNASVTYDEKHPVILSPDHRLTELIIMRIHQDSAHSSAERILSDFRQSFWAPKARATISKTIARCRFCKKLRCQPVIPIMAALPVHRVQHHVPAFANVGIDMFGPMLVTMFRRTMKRYGLMITCLATRAVHLEVMHSMDMDSFIMAFDRFTRRRGTPAHVYCDNGTNFTAGSKEITEGMQRWNECDVADKMSHRGIQWHFNPPSAPHFGGAWERLIRSAKSALKIVLNGRVLNDEILTSALVQVENLLNGRPLTHVSVNPEDPEALTPNHLLLGRSNPNIPPDVIEDRDLTSKKRWRIGQAIAEHFWRRWMREYLPHLIERRKWLSERRNLREGDVVIIIDNNTPRGHWPLGRVLKILPGPDGVVRAAVVKTSQTELVRPVAKLCLLEEAEQPNVSQSGNRAGDVTDGK